ncbi:DnaJ C-terminal domain-containing protein [Streptomyces sp. NBC_00826]|uniref:DnaJ C-terminal domain-containing protein n=1 Tax=Streptomyces sp. NBC_00826 TaxID=2975845 RepID=UPI002F913C51
MGGFRGAGCIPLHGATCKGEGRIIHEQHTQKVRIPAGIRQGQKLRIRELGEHGGAPGDMYATVHVDD